MLPSASFSEADNVKILKAASIIYDEGIGFPILLGEEARIRKIAETNNIDLGDIRIINPRNDEMEEKRTTYGELFFKSANAKALILRE